MRRSYIIFRGCLGFIEIDYKTIMVDNFGYNTLSYFVYSLYCIYLALAVSLYINAMLN